MSHTHTHRTHTRTYNWQQVNEDDPLNHRQYYSRNRLKVNNWSVFKKHYR